MYNLRFFSILWKSLIDRITVAHPEKTSWIKGHEAFEDIRILTCNYFDGNAINFKFYAK